jgi:hypothetical protein
LYKTALINASANVSLNINTTTNGPYVVLLDSAAYTYNAAHDFVNDLSGIIAGGTPPTGRIQNPTGGVVAAGVFDGDNVTFSAVTTPTSIEAFAIFRNNSGANTTWRLVLYENTSVTGLPVTPNGGDITVSWNASGILLI